MLLTTKEIAALLGMKYHNLHYHIHARNFPPPRVVSGRRRFYLAEDVAAMRAIHNQIKRNRTDKKKEEE